MYHFNQFAIREVQYNQRATRFIISILFQFKVMRVVCKFKDLEFDNKWK